MQEEAIKLVQEFVPEYKVVNKSDSKLNKVIGFLLSLVGIKDYMSYYWTTIGYTSYKPTADALDWSPIYHEGLHAQQAKRVSRALFYFLYLFPLSLSPLFLLLMFWHWWFVFFAAFFLLPLPAPFRCYYELKAYAISMMIDKVRGHDVNTEHYVTMFTGPSYYFMMPFKKYVRNKLMNAYADNVLRPTSYVDRIKLKGGLK